jgi:hypothetical protein
MSPLEPLPKGLKIKQYTTVYINDYTSDLELRLNANARKGWRLVHDEFHISNGRPFLIMEREIITDGEGNESDLE